MHDGLMSESNNSRIEAEECLRKGQQLQGQSRQIGLARCPTAPDALNHCQAVPSQPNPQLVALRQRRPDKLPRRLVCEKPLKR
jgi:hypothetical protein